MFYDSFLALILNARLGFHLSFRPSDLSLAAQIHGAKTSGSMRGGGLESDPGPNPEVRLREIRRTVLSA